VSFLQRLLGICTFNKSRILFKVHFKSRGKFMEELAIGEVARRAGIQASALRYYESIGLMPAPKRVNGRRRYNERTIQLLRVVQLAQHAGFTVAEIQTLLHGFAPETPPAARWQPLARQKLLELDALIARAQQMKRVLETGLNCGCLQIEDCAILLEAGYCSEQPLPDGTGTARPTAS
jgi:MerR family transcriptional regulator, redox-sensitive transcriptional activator SoxR